jgi:hypothetical protein
MNFGEDLERQRAQLMRRVRQASSDWAEAMRAHALAPPDLGFATRLGALADAAAAEQAAWEHASSMGLSWKAVPTAEAGQPPYELRPGTGRRGPQELWARFDDAVEALSLAIVGSSAVAVADAFGLVAVAARELSEAVARQDQADEAAGLAERERGAA